MTSLAIVVAFFVTLDWMKLLSDEEALSSIIIFAASNLCINERMGLQEYYQLCSEGERKAASNIEL